MRRPSRARFPHVVDVQLRDTEAQDATGSLDPTGTTIAQAVPCLVADKGGARVPMFSTEIVRKKVRVLFPDPISLGLEHQLLFTDRAGTVRTLLVDSCRDEDDLGLVWVAECQENPRPVTPAG
ncbi:hypothetical protein P12x_003057 [Tundrisphaera lichenicola]|uniref:hypothetical protein n=1 Tax=Tundrisphaera lichenicola TaxID=2029860 RepID=UPI003EC04CD0